jgi:hypothetical protein
MGIGKKEIEGLIFGAKIRDLEIPKKLPNLLIKFFAAPL